MSVEVRVHEGAAAARIARALSLIDEAARPRPLAEVLGVLCAEVAAISVSEIASLYVREEDALVLRANVGFPGIAIDHVRLEMGEGITGFAAEVMRPVTVMRAVDDEHWKAVPGLGEEGFPIFLALPILVGHRTEAVLVLQRAVGHPYSDDEVLLATALATAFAYALERSRARQEGSDEDDSPRHARLRGRGVSGGVALGRVETAPTFDGLAAIARAHGLVDVVGDDDRVARLDAAFDQLARTLRRTQTSLELDAASDAELTGLLLLFEDQILRGLIGERMRAEPNPALAMRDVARAYARAPYLIGLTPDASSTERSAEVEALCIQAALGAVDQRSPSQGAALLLSDRFPAIVALTAATHRTSAIAIGGFIDPSALSVRICRAAKLPVVHGVGGLFAWARGGDRVLVDADKGVVQVNPSLAAVAEFRSGA